MHWLMIGHSLNRQSIHILVMMSFRMEEKPYMKWILWIEKSIWVHFPGYRCGWSIAWPLEILIILAMLHNINYVLLFLFGNCFGSSFISWCIHIYSKFKYEVLMISQVIGTLLKKLWITGLPLIFIYDLFNPWWYLSQSMFEGIWDIIF